MSTLGDLLEGESRLVLLDFVETPPQDLSVLLHHQLQGLAVASGLLEDDVFVERSLDGFLLLLGEELFFFVEGFELHPVRLL